MCDCRNKKKGISEILTIALKYAKIQNVEVILYQTNNGLYDFCEKTYFEYIENNNKKIYEISTYGEIKVI